jgi:3-deoxy-manno-octulosonate cytidylyltransferase (CMP-KDO synthetase)
MMVKHAFKVVIPARFASNRFPGKPLHTICGIPMIVHVCQRAVSSGADQVIVATDDLRIANTVEAAGYQAIMTSEDHASGTDRIAEVAIKEGWNDETIVVNIQGDEPLIEPANIETLVTTLVSQSQADISTIATTITDMAELFDPNAVKVVTDHNNYALYFSRATIPWDRDRFPDAVDAVTKQHQRHIGLYAYRAEFLKRYLQMQIAPIEVLEKLEQLRMLWNGESIIVALVSPAPAAGVDTPEDLLRVEQIMSVNQQTVFSKGL